MWGKPQVKGAQGPVGRPNPLTSRPQLELVQAEDREEWPAGLADGRPTIHQLQTDSIKSVEAPFDLYIRILAVEFRTHHTILVVLHL
jgi:hypothetical protein